MIKQLLTITTVLAMTLTSITGFAEKSDQEGVNLYLIRHGKTMFNTTSQVQGWADSPLTAVGIEGAKAAALGLAQTPFVAAYTSDLGRARHTAKIILEQGNRGNLVLNDDERLREWNYGGYEGRDDIEMWKHLFEELGMEFKPDWSNWGEFSAKMSDEDIANAIARNDKLQWAETYDQIKARYTESINDIVKQTESAGGGNVMIVSHGGAIGSILDIFTPGQAVGADIGNSSVTIIHYQDGKYTVNKAGDLSYLEKGKVLLAK